MNSILLTQQIPSTSLRSHKKPTLDSFSLHQDQSKKTNKFLEIVRGVFRAIGELFQRIFCCKRPVSRPVSVQHVPSTSHIPSEQILIPSQSPVSQKGSNQPHSIRSFEMKAKNKVGQAAEKGKIIPFAKPQKVIHASFHRSINSFTKPTEKSISAHEFLQSLQPFKNALKEMIESQEPHRFEAEVLEELEILKKQLIGKELDPASMTKFDCHQIVEFMGSITPHMIEISQDLKFEKFKNTILISYNPLSDFLDQALEITMRVHNEYYGPIGDLRFSSNIEQRTSLLGGSCYGHSLAVHSFAPVGKESARVGWFLQSSYNLVNSCLNTNWRAIGQEILKKPEDFPEVMDKAALLLGYKKEKRKDLLKDIQTPDSDLKKNWSLSKLAHFIGRLAPREHQLAADAFFESFLKKESLENKNKKNHKPNQSKKTGGVESKEDRELREAVKEVQKFLSTMKRLEKIKAEAPKCSIPKKILERRRLKKEKPIHFEKPIAEFLDALTCLASRKYNLKFTAGKNNITASHTVALNMQDLTFCDTNDVSLSTGLPVLRTFTSAQQMKTFLKSYLNDKNILTEFAIYTLTPISNI